MLRRGPGIAVGGLLALLGCGGRTALDVAAAGDAASDAARPPRDGGLDAGLGAPAGDAGHDAGPPPCRGLRLAAGPMVAFDDAASPSIVARAGGLDLVAVIGDIAARWYGVRRLDVDGDRLVLGEAFTFGGELRSAPLPAAVDGTLVIAGTEVEGLSTFCLRRELEGPPYRVARSTRIDALYLCDAVASDGDGLALFGFTRDGQAHLLLFDRAGALRIDEVLPPLPDASVALTGLPGGGYAWIGPLWFGHLEGGTRVGARTTSLRIDDLDPASPQHEPPAIAPWPHRPGAVAIAVPLPDGVALRVLTLDGEEVAHNDRIAESGPWDRAEVHATADRLLLVTLTKGGDIFSPVFLRAELVGADARTTGDAVELSFDGGTSGAVDPDALSIAASADGYVLHYQEVVLDGAGLRTRSRVALLRCVP
jgi:hypothetical protein